MNILKLSLVGLLSVLSGCWSGHKIEASGTLGRDGQSNCALEIPGVVLEEAEEARPPLPREISADTVSDLGVTLIKIWAICDFQVTKSSVHQIIPGSLSVHFRKTLPPPELPKGSGEIKYYLDSQDQDYNDRSGVTVGGLALNGPFVYSSTKVEMVLKYRQDTIRTVTFKGQFVSRVTGS